MFERRVHYRRQNHYATNSNKYKIVKTPGKTRTSRHASSPPFIACFAHPARLFRWQVDYPILEEKCLQVPRWHPQTEKPRHEKAHRHQENCRQTLRWQAYSHWGQRQVWIDCFLAFVGSSAPSSSKRSSRWRDSCSRRRSPPRRTRRASQRERERSERPLTTTDEEG